MNIDGQLELIYNGGGIVLHITMPQARKETIADGTFVVLHFVVRNIPALL
jgi:hypothetical protein